MAPGLRAEGDGVMLLSPIIISLMVERYPTVGVRNHGNSNESIAECRRHTSERRFYAAALYLLWAQNIR